MVFLRWLECLILNRIFALRFSAFQMIKYQTWWVCTPPAALVFVELRGCCTFCKHYTGKNAGQWSFMNCRCVTASSNQLKHKALYRPAAQTYWERAPLCVSVARGQPGSASPPQLWRRLPAMPTGWWSGCCCRGEREIRSWRRCRWGVWGRWTGRRTPCLWCHFPVLAFYLCPRAPADAL